MTNWLARARSVILQTGQGCTDKADETPDSSVSSVGVWAVVENSELATDLLEAAMRACDHFGDSDAARREMRDQCTATPTDMRQDLLDHFRRTYGAHGPDDPVLTGTAPRPA